MKKGNTESDPQKHRKSPHLKSNQTDLFQEFYKNNAEVIPFQEVEEISSRPTRKRTWRPALNNMLTEAGEVMGYTIDRTGQMGMAVLKFSFRILRAIGPVLIVAGATVGGIFLVATAIAQGFKWIAAHPMTPVIGAGIIGLLVFILIILFIRNGIRSATPYEDQQSTQGFKLPENTEGRITINIFNQNQNGKQ